MLKIKRILSLTFIILLLFSGGSIIFAGEANHDFSTLTLDRIELLSGETDLVKKQKIIPFGNPGDGPAPQVTKIELEDFGWLGNGNFGVILKVFGYGLDETYFDGNRIYPTQQIPFIIYGTSADGFYYVYDCGPITETGMYQFKTTFTSINWPNSKVYYSEYFEFTD